MQILKLRESNFAKYYAITAVNSRCLIYNEHANKDHKIFCNMNNVIGLIIMLQKLVIYSVANAFKKRISFIQNQYANVCI